MGEWMAALSGDAFDLQALTRIPCAEWSVSEDEGVFYLRYQGFSDLTNAEDVRVRAGALVEALNGAMKVHQGDFRLVQVSHVVEISDDGRTHHKHAWETLTLEARCVIKVADTATGEPPKPPEPTPAPVRAAIALKDPKVAKRNLSMRMRQSVAEFSVGAPPRSLGAWVG